MKTVLATGKYAVSFNCRYGDFECGESDMYTRDFAGDDIDTLAAEVIAADPNYPMVFVPFDGENVVGTFRHINDDDDSVDAVMVKSHCL